MANIYVIGNGFDIAHGIKSKYEDFHEYLKTKYLGQGTVLCLDTAGQGTVLRPE